MPPVVKTMDGIATRNQVAHYVHVAAGMIAKAVDNCQNSLELVVRPPPLAVELQTAEPLKAPLTVLHYLAPCGTFP